jgi:hypothetical protein
LVNQDRARALRKHGPFRTPAGSVAVQRPGKARVKWFEKKLERILPLHHHEVNVIRHDTPRQDVHVSAADTYTQPAEEELAVFQALNEELAPGTSRNDMENATREVEPGRAGHGRQSIRHHTKFKIA